MNFNRLTKKYLIKNCGQVTFTYRSKTILFHNGYITVYENKQYKTSFVVNADYWNNFQNWKTEIKNKLRLTF